MAIDFATIKATVTSQIATLTALDPSRVRWVDEPSGIMAGALPVVWLRISSLVPVGMDYETRTDNGANDQTVTVVGQRDFTLSIRIESFTPDIADDRHSMNIGEALRTRLKRSTAIQARSGVFAVREILLSKWIGYVESNRPISAYVLDVLCGTVNVDTDNTIGAGDWIGEVQGSGAVKEQDGSTISSPSFDVTSANPPSYNRN